MRILLGKIASGTGITIGKYSIGPIPVFAKTKLNSTNLSKPQF